MRWQKVAQLAIAAFVIVFAGIVIYTMRQRSVVPSAAAPEAERPADEDAAIYNPGGVNYEEAKDGKLEFRLRADTHVAYADGRQKLGTVEFTLPDRNGRTVVVHADEALLNKPPDQEIGTVHLNRNVRFTTDDGLRVAADDADYDDASGILSIPGPVEFARGRMKGTGIGATYDRNRDVLWLLDQARIRVASDDAGQGAADATAGAAGLARADNYIKLTRDARIVSDDRTITADEVTILLQGDGSTLEQVELRGNSRIVESGANARNMSADEIDLAYADDGRTMESARLLVNAAVELPGGGGSTGRRISGQDIQMRMGPDGSTLTWMQASVNVQVDLPGAGDAPAQQIRSAILNAVGPADAGLQNATFDGGVEYRESRAARGDAPGVDRTARSERLLIRTKPGLGEIEQADFRGRFRFTDGASVTAEAPRALYHLGGDRLELSRHEKEPGPTPFVNDGQLLVEALNIQLSPSSRKLTADTDVRSTAQPRRAKGTDGQDKAAPGQARMPALLERDRPVYAASNRLSYDGVAEATYSGNARLWQDQSGSKIDAGTIVINDETGDLTARGSVRTSMLMEDVDPKTKQKTRTPTIATSEELVYHDAKRLAIYTGKPGRQAHMTGPHGDMVADRIQLHLQEGGRELERAEADGTVTVTQDARTATGTKLVYTASTDTYVMTGNPVEAIEREGPDSCKKIVGTTLTFQRSVGSISADAAGTVPVKSQPVPCPPGPGRAGSRN